MVSSVRVIWTYLLWGKEVAKKNNLTSNLRMVSIVRVIWTYLVGGEGGRKKVT